MFNCVKVHILCDDVAVSFIREGSLGGSLWGSRHDADINDVTRWLDDDLVMQAAVSPF